MNTECLKIRGLKVVFYSGEGFIKAVEGVDIDVREGECVAIVGESGCGKSVTGLSMMRLLSSPPAIWRADEMTYLTRSGETLDLINASEIRLEKLRGDEISMIYQDPSSALNPVMTIGSQIGEIYRYHTELSKKEAREAGIEMLRQVGIPAPEKRYDQFPHELSGGMKQRVLTAMAMALKPRLLIALVMITHDLGVVRSIADRVYVMYCGKIMEQGTCGEILDSPAHPYTKGLIRAIPTLGERMKRFHQIPGNVPSPAAKPDGCYFSNRCDICDAKCHEKMPPLRDIQGEPGHRSRCWRTVE